MTTPPLSPAAQAVVNAHHNVLYSDCPDYESAIAAAIRAVANQVVPAPSAYVSQDAGLIRDEILSIAEELDPQP